jgi:hypothetical protein
MSAIKGYTSAAYVDTGAASHANALHVQASPVSYGALGHYAVTCATATMAAGISADSEILQFRWTSASYLALIHEVSVLAFNSLGTGFTAGIGQFDVTVARSFSAAGTGGTTLTLTGNNQKTRTSMGTSAVGEVRVATTAALGTGTKTLDANKMSLLRFTVGTATNTHYLGSVDPLYRPDVGSGEHPIVLAQNEGLIVRTTMPATGTWDAYLRVRWSEVTAY